MSQNPRPPAYVNWPRFTLLFIGVISVLYGVLHFVAHETVGTPNVAWSAFIGLLAGLGIGIPILIKQRRIAQDGTDQHLGDAAVRSSASWIGVIVGIGLAFVSSLYPGFVWVQLDPPREPIVSFMENRLAYAARAGEGVEGKTSDGARLRYVCVERAPCAWEKVTAPEVTYDLDENRCQITAVLPAVRPLPFAAQPVVAGYSGETCKDDLGARFALIATQDGRVWLWRSPEGALAGDWWLLFFGSIEVVNGLLAGLFAGLLLYSLKGSRCLPVDRWTSLTRATAPLRIRSLRALWSHPFVRLMRLASVVFGVPGFVVLFLFLIGTSYPNWLAESLKAVVIAALFGGLVALPAVVAWRIASEAWPGVGFGRPDLVVACAMLGLWAGALAAFASSEIPVTGWSKLESSPERFVKLTFDPNFASTPDGVCGVTGEGVRYARICKDGLCAWVQDVSAPESRGEGPRCGQAYYGTDRRPLLPLPPGPVAYERSGPSLGAESVRKTFFVLLDDGSVWWWQRFSGFGDLIGWGLSVVWGWITGIVVGVAAARMRREGVDNVGNVVNVDGPIKPDQTLST